jgi:hypothetical protein
MKLHIWHAYVLNIKLRHLRLTHWSIDGILFEKLLNDDKDGAR